MRPAGGEGAARPRSSWPRETRSPSSPGTARSGPAGWTRRPCGPSRTRSATSASWPNARTRSSRRSPSRASWTTRSARRSSPAATRRSSKRLYLPYKPKRRTRATIARQRGLEPLAEFLKRQVNPGVGREEVLRPYINPDQEVPDGEAALRGACDIVAEEWADDAAGPQPGARGDEAGDARLPGPPRLGRKAQQVRDVLRPSRAAGQGPLAPLPGHAARRGRRGPARGDRDRRGSRDPPV